MSRIRWFAIAAGMMIAAPAFAQQYAQILVPEVDVRSGPSKTFYPTSKLKQGDKVEVMRESKEAPGWLEIRPPAQSFSWINSKNVKVIDTTRGYVDCDPTRPAPILPGSRIVDQPPNRESMKLTPGTAIVIVDRPLTVQGETWLPILPHPNEVRYIPSESVNAATVVAAQTGPANWTLTPQGYTTNNVLADAEKARARGDIATARQLYQQVANNAADQNQKVYAMNMLENLPKTNQTPGIPTSNSKPDETRTAFSPNNPNVNLMKLKDAAWSKYGRLYETKLTGENGQPLYQLDAGQGELIYVSTSPGKSLTSYVGRTVSVYGPTMYRGDSAVRLPFVVASHVAVP
jgi:uncharacterized protein YgiM (DUF1202 family)